MKDFLFRGSLADLDPDVDDLINIEAERQYRKLILIPSESTAPAAVRQALADLVREGLLHRRRGKGSFVAAPKIQQDIQTLAGFSSYVKDVLGTDLANRLISVKTVPATEANAAALEVPADTDLVEIRKVKLIDDQPFFLTISGRRARRARAERCLRAGRAPGAGTLPCQSA